MTKNIPAYSFLTHIDFTLISLSESVGWIHRPWYVKESKVQWAFIN